MRSAVTDARERGRICLRYARKPKGSGANRRVWLDLARENFRRAAALTLPVREEAGHA